MTHGEMMGRMSSEELTLWMGLWGLKADEAADRKVRR